MFLARLAGTSTELIELLTVNSDFGIVPRVTTCPPVTASVAEAAAGSGCTLVDKEVSAEQ